MPSRGGKGPVLVGSVAYCPQIPWIVSGSVRDNIVFGSRWEPDWYAEVLEACALQQVSGKVLEDCALKQMIAGGALQQVCGGAAIARWLRRRAVKLEVIPLMFLL